MNDKTKWMRRGYEVHRSTDGIEWFRVGGPSQRPAYSDLAEAKTAFNKARKDFKHVRLVSLEMNFELLQQEITEETENERKAKILNKAAGLFKDSPSVHVHECSYMSMDKIEFSPTYVMIEAHQNLLSGPAPKRADYSKNDSGKMHYLAEYKAWQTKAWEQDEILADGIKKKLTAAGISFTHGKQYGWNIFRLA